MFFIYIVPECPLDDANDGNHYHERVYWDGVVDEYLVDQELRHQNALEQTETIYH